MRTLNEHKSSTPSRWREEVEFRAANKSWLRYSQHIAMIMLDKMKKTWSYSKIIGRENGVQPTIRVKDSKRQRESFYRDIMQDRDCFGTLIASTNGRSILINTP